MFQEFLQEVFWQNGEKHSFADFYYEQCSAEEKSEIKRHLTVASTEFLSYCFWEADTVYYPLSPGFLKFLVELSYSELLFSSFYFCRYPCTIWGNYNGSFPVFFESKEEKRRYLCLAEKMGFSITDLRL